MHKLAKGLKKKKKQKKGKKVEDEEEFDAEELERYRRERAEAQQKLTESKENIDDQATKTTLTGNDEWKKFQDLTSGIDSVLKKTQNDLDRIKSTSFFQRKVSKSKDHKEDSEVYDKKPDVVKRYVGFDKDGNPIEQKSDDTKKIESVILNEDGFVNVSDNEEEHDDSTEEDIFDTTYIDVLQNIDVKLAYIPDSPTNEEFDEDPFDTTNADKVLKTVDKTGKKLVSLGNAVEVLSGRVDYVSSCKIDRRISQSQNKDLLGDFDNETLINSEKSDKEVNESLVVEKTLLDDDSDLPDVPIDLTIIPPILPRSITTNIERECDENKTLDISEFELLKDKTLLDQIPILNQEDFDSDTPINPDILEEIRDPFAEKESEKVGFQEEIIEVSFEVATFVNEEDPFDTTIADNILPSKIELKCIEKELEELPKSEHSISTIDISECNRDYKYDLLKEQKEQILSIPKKDLLGGSITELNQLIDKPIKPVEELSYVDPFDTSSIIELPPGKTELKFLEKELLGDKQTIDSVEDNDFDPRKEDVLPLQKSNHPINILNKVIPKNNHGNESLEEESSTIINFDPFDTSFLVNDISDKTEIKVIKSEVLQTQQISGTLNSSNNVQTNVDESLIDKRKIFDKRQDSILDTNVDADATFLVPNIASNIIEEKRELSYEDPFDTSYATNILPGKVELKLLEDELSQIPDPVPTQSHSIIELVKQKVAVEKDTDFLLRIEEIKENDILCWETQEPCNKILTPTQSIDVSVESIDPFDTSFANIDPGKTELKLLESELMNR